MKKTIYYAYADFLDDMKVLSARIEAGFGIPQAIVCIARGGMCMSHFLALKWNLRAESIYTINATSYADREAKHSLTLGQIPHIEQNRVLIVDEIVDSGRSLSAVMRSLGKAYPRDKFGKDFASAVIFQKSGASVVADFYVRENKEWIDFFWEVDMLDS